MSVGPQRHDRLKALLATVDYEVIPLSTGLEAASALPAGSTVTVTASPSRGQQATIDLASTLAQSGFRVVPHLAARMIRDRSHLTSIVDSLTHNEVTGAFVIGGDPEPAGKYRDAGSLLRDMAEIGHPFTQVGIAGYPEGHPSIAGDRLREALHEKSELATYLVTQMCFEPTVVVDWVRAIRGEGIQLPVKLGVPGAVDLPRLLRIGTRVGVGDSMRLVAKNRGLLRLLRRRRYRPDRLIEVVAGVEDDLGLDGLHLFTFNQVAASVAWRDEWLSRLD